MSDQTAEINHGKGSVARTTLVECAVLLLFVALTVMMTWPLAAHLETAVSDPGDPLLNVRTMSWTWQSLTTPGAEFWDVPYFHPLRYTTAFTENLLGITVWFLPLFAAGVKPLVIYNIAMLAGFAFSGYGAYVLGRLLTGSRGAGIVGGIFFAFVPYRFDHMAHLQHVWSGWLPLALAALVFYGRRPSWQRAALIGGALLVNGLSNGHWLLFGGVAIGLGAILLAILSGRTFDRRFWLPLLVSLAITHGILGVVLRPYGIAGELYGMRRWAGEAKAYSAKFSDWMVASRQSRFYGGTTSYGHAEVCLFPGAIVLLLASLSVLLLRRGDLDAQGACVPAEGAGEMPEERRRKLLKILDAVAFASFVAMCIGFADRAGDDATVETWRKAALPAMLLVSAGFARLWIAWPGAWDQRAQSSLGEKLRGSRLGLELQLCVFWVILGVVGSLGMNSFFHQFLFTQLEPFRSLRVPARWSMIAYVGLAGLAAAGAVALTKRVRESRRPLVAVGISLLLLLELRAAPIRWYFFDTRPPVVYKWLAKAPTTGAVLELPIAQYGWGEYIYLFRQISHRKPILNGISGYPTKLHDRLERAMSETPITGDLYGELERAGCGLLIVHNERFDAFAPLRVWLKQGIDSGRLTFVRRFDHGTGGDWVFALTGVEKNLAALRAPEIADPAGRMPSDNLQLFLADNGRTYNASTFIWLDQPKYNDEPDGELIVSGWTLSPYDVKDVRLVFGNGTLTLPVERFEWPRLHEKIPWYPQTLRPGFRAVIPTRPASLDLETDLRVEVVDGRGETTAYDHLFLRWHPRRKFAYTKWNEQRLPSMLGALHVDDEAGEKIRSGNIDPLVDAVLAAHQEPKAEAFIAGIYRDLLGREAEGDAIAFYLMRLDRGSSRRGVVEAILASKEFRKRMLR
ncbi:MAG: DUF4214 domain-containing protein [Thermoanaerobaculia bacterium]